MAEVESSHYRWDNRELWKKSDHWTKFSRYWRQQKFSSLTEPKLTVVPKEFLHEPSLGNMFQILSHNQDGTILVLDQYRTMIKRILARYQSRLVGNSGCVVTGQPGVGKSILLCLLLVVLLQSKTATPIVFYHHKRRVVFFKKKAYVEIGFKPFDPLSLPRPSKNPQTSETPIPRTWVLIDMGYSTEAPDLLEAYGFIFPVQSASPNPVRYRNWSSEFLSAQWILPLWTRDQIHTGWKIQVQYRVFRSLVQHWMNNEITQAHLDQYPDHTNIVRAHCEHCPMVSHNSACLDMVITAHVDQAIELFGYSPRDIYGYLECPHLSRSEHESAVGGALTSWESVAQFVRKFDAIGEAETHIVDPGRAGARASHRIIALDVVPNHIPNTLRDHDSIVYIWKSPFIKKAMMDNFSILKEEEQARYYKILETSAKGSVIARSIYKRHAHEFFTSAKVKCCLPLQPMCLKGATYETTTDPAFYPELSSGLELQEYGPDLSTISILEGCYYRSNYDSQPLFDSFIIEISNGFVVLNMIQFGKPDIEQGVDSGYVMIDKLRSLANSKFRLPVRVRYVYVSSELLPNKIPKVWELPRTDCIDGEIWYLGLPYPFDMDKFEEAKRVLESRQIQKLDKLREQEQMQTDHRKRKQGQLQEDEMGDGRKRRQGETTNVRPLLPE